MTKSMTGGKLFGMILFLALAILLFFSKTIYSSQLPVVTATSPFKGKLEKKETVTAVADWDQAEYLYAPIAGTVKTLLVSENDRVAKGQAIAEMAFERDEVTRQLDELGLKKEKLLLDQENMELKIQNLHTNRALLEAENYREELVSDYEVVRLKEQISRETEQYDRKKTLYEGGVITRQELDTSAEKLADLELELENQIRLYDQALEKEKDTIEKKEKERQNQLLNYDQEKAGLDQELKALQIDWQQLLLQEQVYRDALEKYGENNYLYAPSDGAITKWHIQKGEHVSDNQLIASFGVGNGFFLPCELPLNNNFVAVGDVCLLENTTHKLQGVVKKIDPDEQSKKAVVYVASDAVMPGETFTVTFEKEGASSQTLVPNGALNKDSTGYFLLQVKEREGVLGKEFYTEKTRVHVGDTDGANTIITKGVQFFEPIVLLSDKPFDEGEAIKVKNEGDFFAKN